MCKRMRVRGGMLKSKLNRIAWECHARKLLELTKRQSIGGFHTAWCGRNVTSSVYETCCWSLGLVWDSFDNSMLFSITWNSMVTKNIKSLLKYMVTVSYTHLTLPTICL